MKIFRNLFGTLVFPDDTVNPSYPANQAEMPGTFGMQNDQEDTLEEAGALKRTYSQYTGETFLPTDPKVRIVEVQPRDVRTLEEAVDELEKQNEDLEEIIKHDRARYDEIVVKYDALAVELYNAERNRRDVEAKLEDVNDEALVGGDLLVGEDYNDEKSAVLTERLKEVMEEKAGIQAILDGQVLEIEALRTHRDNKVIEESASEKQNGILLQRQLEESVRELETVSKDREREATQHQEQLIQLQAELQSKSHLQVSYSETLQELNKTEKKYEILRDEFTNSTANMSDEIQSAKKAAIDSEILLKDQRQAFDQLLRDQEQLKGEMSQSVTNLELLSTENRRMKQGFENLTKKNEELEAEVTSLKNNLSPEIQNLQKASSDANRRFTEKSQALAELEDRYTRLQDDLDATIKSSTTLFNASKEAHQLERQTLASEVESLKTKLGDLERENITPRTTPDILTSDVDELAFERQLADKQEDYEQLSSEHELLKTELNHAVTNSKALSIDNEQMLRQVESLTKKNGVLKAEVASAKNDLLVKTLTYRDAETSWTNKRSEFENRCTYLQSEVDRYLENDKALSVDRDRMTQEIQMLTEKNQDLQAECINATDNLDRALRDLSREKDECAVKDQALTDLQGDFKELAEAELKSKMHLVELQRSQNDLATERDTLQRKLGDQTSRANVELAKARREMVANAEAKRIQLEDDLKQVRVECQSKQILISDLRKELDAKILAIHNAQAGEKNLQVAVEQLEAEIAKSKSELSETQRSLADCSRATAKLEEQLRSLKRVPSSLEDNEEIEMDVDGPRMTERARGKLPLTPKTPGLGRRKGVSNPGVDMSSSSEEEFVIYRPSPSSRRGKSLPFSERLQLGKPVPVSSPLSKTRLRTPALSRSVTPAAASSQVRNPPATSSQTAISSGGFDIDIFPPNHFSPLAPQSLHSAMPHYSTGNDPIAGPSSTPRYRTDNDQIARPSSRGRQSAASGSREASPLYGTDGSLGGSQQRSDVSNDELRLRRLENMVQAFFSSFRPADLGNGVPPLLQAAHSHSLKQLSEPRDIAGLDEQDVEKTGLSSVLATRSHASFEKHRQEAARPMPTKTKKTVKHNDIMKDVREKQQHMLGISKDNEVLDAARKGHCASEEDVNAFAAGRHPGPSLDFLKPDWQNSASLWNKTLAELFAVSLMEEKPELNGCKDAIIAHFIQRIYTLQRTVSKRLPQSATDDPAEVEALYQEQRQVTLHNGRVRARQTSLYDARLSFTAHMMQLEPTSKVWPRLHAMVFSLTLEGQSEDESDGDDFVRVKQIWRCPEVEGRLDYIDECRERYMRTPNGARLPGATFRKRCLANPRRRLMYDARQPPRCLPINLYNEAWYIALGEGTPAQVAIEASEPVNLPKLRHCALVASRPIQK